VLFVSLVGFSPVDMLLTGAKNLRREKPNWGVSTKD